MAAYVLDTSAVVKRYRPANSCQWGSASASWTVRANAQARIAAEPGAEKPADGPTPAEWGVAEAAWLAAGSIWSYAEAGEGALWM